MSLTRHRIFARSYAALAISIFFPRRSRVSLSRALLCGCSIRKRLWTIYWADSNAVRLDDGKVGSFDGDIGEFFGRDVFRGEDIAVKFLWDKRNPEAPVWSAAFSVNEGQTWEWNWHAYFARR
jgi:hypothetical protein